MAHLENPPEGNAAEAAMNNASRRVLGRVFSDRLLQVVFLGGLLVLWELAATRRWVNPLFFPAPSAIGKALVAQLANGEILVNAGSTLKRAGAGLALGSVAGILLGILLGISSRIRHLFDPIVGALYPIPKLALFPLFLIFFGLGDAPRIALVSLASFFPVLINTVAGARQINPEYFEIAQSYGADRRIMLARVVVPGAMPSVLSGLRLAVGNALITTIAVELMNSRDGLGAQIWWAWETLQTGNLYVAVLVTGILGIGSHYLLEFVSQKLLPWQREETKQQTVNPIPEI
jgi:ABC-type nitrate/sulfonate/bicarbonate transport system permease component